MTAKILLILVLVTTIIPVSLLFGIPASKYNKKVQKINWIKGLDVAMKNQVTDQYSYQERSEQIKLRSYFEKQHQDIELRKKLALVK